MKENWKGLVYLLGFYSSFFVLSFIIPENTKISGGWIALIYLSNAFLFPWLLVFIINSICELLDILFNRKQISELLIHSQCISVEKFENETKSCNEKINSLKEKIKKEEHEGDRKYLKEKWNFGKSKLEILKEQRFIELFKP